MPWTHAALPAQTNVADGYRKRSFKDAIQEAQAILLAADPAVFILGEGVDDASAVFGSTQGLLEKFGSARIVDTPLAENGMMGIAIGAAMTGMRPLFIHMRCDFLIIALDQLLNHAAKWSYMSAGKVQVPLTIRAIIGRGWGSAAQHAQSIQSLLAHLPGLKVVMPATAYDAKGLLISAVCDNNPVVLLEHRWLYDQVGSVPAGSYKIPLGKANCCRTGQDLTIVATSQMVHEAMKAAEHLDSENIQAEVIDLRTVKPLDRDSIVNSVRKTGTLIVADTGHLFAGIGAEVCSLAAEQCFSSLTCPPIRIALPEAPVPACHRLEEIYYPGVKEIIQAAKACLAY